jgi:hypothetical protein
MDRVLNEEKIQFVSGHDGGTTIELVHIVSWSIVRTFVCTITANSCETQSGMPII